MTPSASTHVVRGGVWTNVASLCRSASRYNLSSTSRAMYYGFRVVRTLDTPLSATVNNSLSSNGPTFDQWMKDLAALPAEKQVDAVAAKLVELNPGFDGKMEKVARRKRRGDRFEFQLQKCAESSPLRALTGLKALNFAGEQKLTDLSPLRLNCRWRSCIAMGAGVSDLSPLRRGSRSRR